MLDVSIDVGSGMTKATCNGCRDYLPSFSGPCDEPESFNVKNDDGAIVKFKGKTFATGLLAKNKVPPSALANTRDERWFQSEEYLALMYAALSKVLPKEYNGKVSLCTGLPQAFYGRDQDDLMKILVGKHQFFASGSRYCVTLRKPDLVIMPQVMGLFLSRLKDDPTLQAGRVALLDIGTYTSDWTIVDDCSTVEWASGGVAVGVSDILNGIIEYAAQDLGARLTFTDAVDVVRSGQLDYLGKRINVEQRIQSLAMAHAPKLIDTLRPSWEDASSARIILGGGGSKLFGSAIRTEYPHATVIPDENPIFSVVDGYEQYLTMRKAERAAQNAS